MHVLQPAETRRSTQRKQADEDCHLKAPYSVSLRCSLSSLWLIPSAAEPLPNTKPLTEDGDLAAKMVAGIHKYLDRELAAAPKKRDEPGRSTSHKARKRSPSHCPRTASGCGRCSASSMSACSRTWNTSRAGEAVAPRRDRRLQGSRGALGRAAGRGCRRAAHRAEGQAEGERRSRSRTPISCPRKSPGSRRATTSRCGWPGTAAGSRADAHRPQGRPLRNPKLKRQTNIPHREFVHRMAYEMGRTLTGYEVQKVLAAVDWFKSAGRQAAGRRDRLRRRRHDRAVCRRRWTSGSRRAVSAGYFAQRENRCTTSRSTATSGAC